MPTHNTLANDLGVGAMTLAIRGRAAATVLWGTAIAGTLDICAAITSWMLRGVPARRVLQGVASGLLGRDSFNGGTATAALGLVLHFAIMSVIVAVYYAASRKLPALRQRAAWCGVAYGAAVYFFMSFIVVPLSASPGGLPAPSAIALGVLVHVLCVGLPIAFITRRFASAQSTGE